MLLVLPFYNGDRALAEKWAAWSNELGPYPNHDMLIVRDHRAEAIPQLGKTFRSVSEMVVTDDRWDEWPQSPNNCFQKAARHIEYLIKKPWLWMEPDAWPLGEGWLDAIEAEYMTCGKPFMGDRVDVAGVPVHCSGIAVYPGILTEYAGEALMATDIAWDTYACRQIVSQMHETKKIAHSWDRELDAKMRDRKARFENYRSVINEVFLPHPEAVIYHADKTGSLPDLLRQAKGLKSEKPATQIQKSNEKQPALAELPKDGIEEIQSGKWPEGMGNVISEEPALTQKELIAKLGEHFTTPLGKGRIIKALRAIPVIKP